VITLRYVLDHALSEALPLWQASANSLPLWYGAGPTADDTSEPRMQQVSSEVESLQCFQANAPQQSASCTLRLMKVCTMRQVADRRFTAAWPAEADRYSAVFQCLHAFQSTRRSCRPECCVHVAALDLQSVRLSRIIPCTCRT
jgi:hypothetical protein